MALREREIKKIPWALGQLQTDSLYIQFCVIDL